MVICETCGQDRELRLGHCFDCAHAGERRAAKRTVVQHLAKGVWQLWKRRPRFASYEFRWAWQRLWRTGDYAKDGYFDSEGHDWR